MKKVLFIMTMLVVSMGVSFTTNAQDTVDIYSTYSSTTIDTDWSVDPDVDDVNSAYYNGPGVISLHANYGSENAKFSFEKGFNFDDLDSAKFTYDVFDTGNGTAGPFNYTFEIFISDDGGSTYTSVSTYTGNPGESTDFILDNVQFAPNGTDTYIKIEMRFYQPIPTVSGYENIEVKLNDFSIEGYETTTSVGITENDLEDNLEIYSYNKSVFFTSNENVNANVTVYNMSGQVVSNENMNISTSKTEVNLDYLNSGMYIISVNDGMFSTSKKVYLQ